MLCLTFGTLSFPNFTPNYKNLQSYLNNSPKSFGYKTPFKKWIDNDAVIL